MNSVEIEKEFSFYADLKYEIHSMVTDILNEAYGNPECFFSGNNVKVLIKIEAIEHHFEEEE